MSAADKGVWTLANAKARLSELVERASREGPTDHHSQRQGDGRGCFLRGMVSQDFAEGNARGISAGLAVARRRPRPRSDLE